MTCVIGRKHWLLIAHQNFQNCLLSELLFLGEALEVCHVDHMNYVSEMSKTSIYDITALVAYDKAMLERARTWDPVVSHGADKCLTNRKLVPRKKYSSKLCTGLSLDLFGKR